MKNCAVKVLVVNTPWQTVQRWESTAQAESHFHARLSRSVPFYTFGPDADGRKMIVPRGELAAIIFEDVDVEVPAAAPVKPTSPRVQPPGLASAGGRLAAVPSVPASAPKGDLPAGAEAADPAAQVDA